MLTCGICLQPHGEEQVETLECGHVFPLECVDTWFRTASHAPISGDCPNRCHPLLQQRRQVAPSAAEKQSADLAHTSNDKLRNLPGLTKENIQISWRGTKWDILSCLTRRQMPRFARPPGRLCLDLTIICKCKWCGDAGALWMILSASFEFKRALRHLHNFWRQWDSAMHCLVLQACPLMRCSHQGSGSAHITYMSKRVRNLLRNLPWMRFLSWRG